MTEEQIVYENGNFWVAKLGSGQYEIYKNMLTHAVRCGIVSYGNDNEKALKAAITECDRKASLNN
ncbi:hypothetical protein [Sinomicrobium sp.]